ncbi:MAG TPA: 2-hydroxyacyl-CoA dehydratase family protein [Syntrophales bacterium]|nr:2-hydroxyacyl-CoA dehydratase family protein [Syntrophales bacterium]HPQ43539.1 2-hydroxyacyl-CoA dehydratase family protein [Syntrophales bacterium]
MERFDDFHEAASDTEAYIRNLKESGRKVLGYMCSYTPEEIIYAAGAHPLRLFGAETNSALADAHLQSYTCSLARGVLEGALSGKLNYLDGMVFPHTCDTVQRLSDIWRLNTDFGFFTDIVLPVKLDTESAKEYMNNVLCKFRRDLEKGMGVTVTDETLKESIETYNTIRGCLKAIYELRSEEPGILTGGDVHAIVKGSMIMDRKYLLKRLPEVIETLRGAKAPSDTEKKRVALVGSICNHPDIYAIIEQSGGVVVWDDLCTGSRYFEGEIGTDGDPIAAIADRYIKRQICPAKYMSTTSRGDSLVEMIRKHRVQGVIFLLLKFCDPHDFDYPYMKGFLDRERIPSMLLEIEDHLPSEGQLLTRFETFTHML